MPDTKFFIENNLKDLLKVTRTVSWKYQLPEDDFSQDCFAKALSYNTNFVDLDNFLPWWWTLCVNKATDIYRGQKRLPHFNDIETAYNKHNKTDDLESRDSLAKMYRFIRNKCSIYTANILYLRNKGYSYEEIGELFNMKPSSIRVKICLCKKLFQKEKKQDTPPDRRKCCRCRRKKQLTEFVHYDKQCKSCIREISSQQALKRRFNKK